MNLQTLAAMSIEKLDLSKTARSTQLEIERLRAGIDRLMHQRAVNGREQSEAANISPSVPAAS